MLPALLMSACCAREVEQGVWILSKRQLPTRCVVHGELGSALRGQPVGLRVWYGVYWTWEEQLVL